MRPLARAIGPIGKEHAMCIPKTMICLLAVLLLLAGHTARAGEAHPSRKRDVTTNVLTQVLSCPASSGTYTKKISSVSRAIRGSERLGSEGNVLGSFTGTETVTVTESFVKGQKTKVRRTTTTAVKNYTGLTFDPAVTKKLLGLIDYRLKRAWESLGLTIRVDGTYGRSVFFLPREGGLYVGPAAVFEDILYCMGHFSSFVCGGIYSTSGWRTIWNAERGQMQGSYAGRALLSPQEMYCAAFYQLIRKPSALRRNAPQAYAGVQNAPAKITQVRLQRIARGLRAAGR